MSLRLALLLLIVTASLPALAAEARQAPGRDACSTADEDPTNPRPAERHGGTTDEIRERTGVPRGGGSDGDGVRAPRWHSFLPGMFR